MHLSKLQGKRSLGLSALLAQRNSETKPVGLLHSPGDEPSSDSKFSHFDDLRYATEQTFAPPAADGLEMHQEFLTLPDISILQMPEIRPPSQSAVASLTGIANWKLHACQISGVAAWKMCDDLLDFAPPHSRQERVSEVSTGSANKVQILSTLHTDVNIFQQSSRDINSIFDEKQKKIIVDLNAATASLKLQLQGMQQERDDVVLEVSMLSATIEEQKHEQQTQLLSFSLKLLQDEAEMRKHKDEIHEMREQIDLYRRCLKEISDAFEPRSTGSDSASSISQKIASVRSKYFPNNMHETDIGAKSFALNQELSSRVEGIMLNLDRDLAPHSEALKPIFEDMDKKYLDQQLQKELEIANLTAQIQHSEALFSNLQKQNAHAIFNSLAIDEISRKNAKKCDEHEAVIRRLQEELTAAHLELKDRDVVLLHCLRDINVVRSEYATLEMERKLQYQASERVLAQRMQLSSKQDEDNLEKIQNFRDLLSQKDSCLDDLRGRCELVTSENGIMLKKVFALESLCSETQSTLSRCRGELDIALLEKQMLTKIDEQRRLSQLQSSDSYHSQLELDYKASQETIDELRKKCDNYQSSWFQFEKKIREEKREWQHSKEQELRLVMEVSMNERVGTIEAEIKNLRQKSDDSKAAQMVEISTIRNQLARASNQAAVAHAHKVHELNSLNESCMQRILQLQQLCQALQKGNFSKHFNMKSL